MFLILFFAIIETYNTFAMDKTNNKGKRSLEFTKMQGAGNDYIYVNGFSQDTSNLDLSRLARQLSDRHFGIGSDGLVFILPSHKADFRMRMFNSDGSEAEMCGNASRCIGRYVFDHKFTSKTNFTLETKAGIKGLDLHLDADGQIKNITVDMGEPQLTPSLIPVNINKDKVIGEPIEVDGKTWNITCVSMGNPHAAIFTTGIDQLNLPEIGPKFENHPIFPSRTNTEFIEIIDRKTLKMRVWERGAGETLACGTGACASLVAAVLNNLSEREATLKLLGGDLQIKWDEKTNHILMTGEATTVFEGTVYFEA